MKKAALITIAGLLFWAVTGISSLAQEKKAEYFSLPIIVNCGSLGNYDDTLKDYQELPFALGTVVVQTPDGKFWTGDMEMHVNPDTGTYTLFGIFEDKFACIIAPGGEISPAPWGIKS